MALPIVGRIQLLAPLANQQFETKGGTVYTSDSNGLIQLSSVQPNDYVSLLNMGCVQYVPTWLGKLIGANMNVTTDNIIPLLIPPSTGFRVTRVTVRNASASLTTAAGGVYTAPAKGGTALVAATQVYSALTGPTLLADLTIAATPGNTVWQAAAVPNLYLNLTTAQGAAATADVFVYGDVYL
jgi:hypothetical protein